MALLDTVESVAESISASTIVVDTVRCSYLRHAQSTCTACLDACPHGAIRRSKDSLSIDAELCTDCGACALACPTRAFSTACPTPAELVNALREDAAGNDGIARVCCRRDADLLAAELEDAPAEEEAGLAGVVVPCLAYLDEYLVLGLYAVGVAGVSVYSRGCAECGVGNGSCVRAMLRSLGALAHAFRLDLPFEMTDDPVRLLVTGAVTGEADHGGERPENASRREGLRELGAAVAGTAARELAERLHLAVPAKPAAADLKVRLPLESYRSSRLLDMLRRLSPLASEPSGGAGSSDAAEAAGPAEGLEVAVRFWKLPVIDERHCLRCGSCAAFCTTGALTYEEVAPGSEKYTLTFHPDRCVACGICADLCLTRSMKLGASVRVRDLLAGERTRLFTAEETRLYRGWGR